LTSTVGGKTGGYFAIGRTRIEMPPPKTNTSESTIVITGWEMKKSVFKTAPSRGRSWTFAVARLSADFARCDPTFPVGPSISTQW
jgi:hypothetical protein